MGMNINDEEVKKKLSDIDTKVSVYIKMRMSTYAKQMESYAKRNRPWTDRTSRARQSLQGFITDNKSKKEIEVGIAHGVDYGSSLEFEHEKRYAILFPTLKQFSSRIMKSFKNIMDGIV